MQNFRTRDQNERGVSPTHNGLYFYTVRYKPGIKTPDFLQNISKLLNYFSFKKNVLLYMAKS
jgi:hypothetical protein